MSYAVGQLIQNDEYNTFATGTISGTPNNGVANINTIWGTGNGNKGLGQSTTLSAVATGAVITANQWSTMTSRLSSIRNHQGSSYTPSPSTPTTGNLIQILSNLSSSISSGYTDVQNGVVYGRTSLVSNNTQYLSGWVNEIDMTITITFSSGDAARYFFNAGGRIEFTFSRSGGSGTQKDLDWSTLCTEMGTLLFATNSTTASGNTGAAYTTLTTGSGYYQMAVGATTIAKKFNDTGNADYNLNYIQVDASTNGVVGSNADNGNILTFVVKYVDAASDTYSDTVDGTLQTSVVVNGPGTAYISNVWGTPTYSGSASGS